MPASSDGVRTFASMALWLTPESREAIARGEREQANGATAVMLPVAQKNSDAGRLDGAGRRPCHSQRFIWRKISARFGLGPLVDPHGDAYPSLNMSEHLLT